MQKQKIKKIKKLLNETLTHLWISIQGGNGGEGKRWWVALVKSFRSSVELLLEECRKGKKGSKKKKKKMQAYIPFPRSENSKSNFPQILSNL